MVDTVGVGQSVEGMNLKFLTVATDATEKGITYSLKDANPTDCATISSNIVTAVKEGSVKVVATSKDGGFTAEAAVTISAAAPDPEPVHKGTLDDPYDANDAVIVGNKLDDGEATASDYYIKGVAEKAQFGSKYSCYSFEIGQGFLCYNLNNGEGKKPFAVSAIFIKVSSSIFKSASFAIRIISSLLISIT